MTSQPPVVTPSPVAPDPEDAPIVATIAPSDDPLSLIPDDAMVGEACAENITAAESAMDAAGRDGGSWLRWIRRVVGGFGRYGLVLPARTVCLVVLLAVTSAVPVVQLVVLGYLLDIKGRVARGEAIRQSLFLLPQAGRIGMALAAAAILALPIRMLAYWAYVAELIEPNHPQATLLRIGGAAVAVAGFVYLVWAWVRGGRISHYLWPQPVRFCRESWHPATWSGASDALWEFARSLRLPQLFWLGIRGTVGVLAWIAGPALLLVVATRNGETGLAGIVGATGFLLMAICVMYLPLVQAHFAAENRFRAMFELRAVRSAFRAAPAACWIGTALILILALPLYLLKIEATPREVVWLPAIFFLAFMLPGHLIGGWALRRARRREPGKRWWNVVTRITFRLLTVPVVVVYLLFLYGSQLTSWDGLATWFQQHAFLVPVPFVGV